MTRREIILIGIIFLILGGGFYWITNRQQRIDDLQELNESSFSTHSASLKLIEDFFQMECQSKVMLLAAQPKHVNFGQPPSDEMVTAVDVVSQLLTNILDSRSSGEICYGSAGD